MLKEQPLISILLPCYNAMEYLEEALASLLGQTYQNIEILAIDDGSSDDTLSYLRTQAKADSRIRVIQNEENLGLIDTLNKGIELANGDYIARMDADDISLPNRIEQQLKFIESNNLDLIGCQIETINELGEVVTDRFKRNITQDESILASFLFTPLIHPTIFARKEVLKDNKYQKIEKAIHAEDYELWCRLIQKKYRVGNQDEVLFQLRNNGNSVSHKFESIQKKNFSICARDHYNTYFKKDVSQEVYNVVVNRFESINRKKLNLGLEIIDELSNFYQQKKQGDLPIFMAQHKVNIYVSAFKRGAFPIKLSILFKFFIFLFNKDTRKFLLGKFKK